MEDKRAAQRFLQTRTEEAFCSLFVAVYGRVRRYFVLRGLDAATAEDLAQNVLFTVHRQAGELRDHELFFGWLFAIARSELLRHWRSRKARIETVEYEPLAPELAEQFSTLPPVWQNIRLQEWLQYLEPAERDLIMLRYVEELSYEELSTALDVPLGTVKWRLFNAKKKLAPHIQQSGNTTTRKLIN